MIDPYAMVQPRVWLITGASSGFGRLLTEAILKHGEIVVATARNTSTLSSLALLHPSNRLLVLHCDVTRPADIRAAFAQIIERFRRCDVVFNNAGFGVVSEAESTAQDELAREMFEVNFWGAANVSREAVRIFRDVNPKGEGGRLITVSSAAGFTAYPAFGYYSASKHAIEGFTETLRSELDPAWNIKVSLLLPGAFKTGIQPKTPRFPCHPAYCNPALPNRQVRQWYDNEDNITGDPAAAAELIYKFSSLPSPPLRWPLGLDCISGVRNKLKVVAEEVKELESWSEDIVIRPKL